MNLAQSESVMRSAERRMNEALAELRRMAFGDEEYHREANRVRVLDELARLDPPPAPGVRKRLIPNWARRKLGW